MVRDADRGLLHDLIVKVTCRTMTSSRLDCSSATNQMEISQH
jgi:hypothetical protein